MVQAVGNPRGIFTERLLRAQIDGAVSPAVDQYRRIAERDRAQGGRVARAAPCRALVHARRVFRGSTHVRTASPLQSCDRETRGSGAWLPCRFAQPSPSATPSKAPSAGWLPRSLEAPAARRSSSA